MTRPRLGVVPWASSLAPPPPRTGAGSSTLTGASRLHHERQHRQMTGTLNRHRELALVLSACPRAPPRLDLPAVGQKAPQHFRLLVINVSDLFLTEKAPSTSPHELTWRASPVLRPSPTSSRRGSYLCIPIFLFCQRFNLPGWQAGDQPTSLRISQF
jgi:hypothetical protein